MHVYYHNFMHKPPIAQNPSFLWKLTSATARHVTEPHCHLNPSTISVPCKTLRCTKEDNHTTWTSTKTAGLNTTTVVTNNCSNIRYRSIQLLAKHITACSERVDNHTAQLHLLLQLLSPITVQTFSLTLRL